MSIGQVFMGLACLLFFLAGIGVSAIPNMITWGFFTMTLGFITSGILLWRNP